MMYFTGVNTLDELKAAYRRLSLKHHPDCGGDEETMKAINAEHFEELKKQRPGIEAEKRIEKQRWEK